MHDFYSTKSLSQEGFLSHTSPVVSGHLHGQTDTQKAHITISPVRQNCSRTWRNKSEQAGKKIKQLYPRNNMHLGTNGRLGPKQTQM